MRIRITKTYEKELIPAKRQKRDLETGRLLFDNNGRPVLEDVEWVDTSYMDADPEDYTQDKYDGRMEEEDKPLEAPTFPITDPRDAAKVDRLDHEFNGYDLERDLEYDALETKWEIIGDDGLPYNPDSRVSQLLDDKEITSGEPKGWLSTATPPEM